MNFIQKRIQQKRLQEEAKKEEIFKQKCCHSIPLLEFCMENLKTRIDNFSINKKGITTQDAEDFIFNIMQIEVYYGAFLRMLKVYEKDNKKFVCYTQRELEYMTKKKKEYRHIFERFYINFKRISKGCDFPRRNEILGKMRKAFDFDSSKYYAQFQSVMG